MISMLYAQQYLEEFMPQNERFRSDTFLEGKTIYCVEEKNLSTIKIVLFVDFFTVYSVPLVKLVQSPKITNYIE